jgi:hypothetical protein
MMQAPAVSEFIIYGERAVKMWIAVIADEYQAL